MNFDPERMIRHRNYESGDQFAVGTWEVIFELQDVISQLAEICSFVITVEGRYIIPFIYNCHRVLKKGEGAQTKRGHEKRFGKLICKAIK